MNWFVPFVLIVNVLVKEPTDSITEGKNDEECEFPSPALCIPLTLFPVDEAELLEHNESPADRVYRYLEGVVAWAVALHQLLKPDLLKNFSVISVDIVLVTGFRSDIMSTDDVISGLLKRYPNSKNFIQTSKPYIEAKVPSFFHGAIHAEATLTLMGFMSYISFDNNDDEHSGFDAGISNPDTFKKIFRPVCCHFLSFS